MNKNSYCNYSFEDLYFAAFGKKLNKKLKEKFKEMSQDKINLLVLNWAKKANWTTNKKIGDDNIVYISFQPKKIGF